MKLRRAAESVEQREARPEGTTNEHTESERRAAESVEQRAARLQQMSTIQGEILPAELAEEREAMLLHMSANQCERRAAESSQLTCSSREEPFKVQQYAIIA